jgi:intraflagellar transport protein 81
VPRGEEFKRYVNKLRSKSTTYKKLKQEIAQLQTELNILKRTEEIIRKKYDTIKSQLTPEERGEVESGFNVRRTNVNVDRVEEALSQKELKAKISAKKAELAPFIQELKSLRDVIDVSLAFINLKTNRTNLFIYLKAIKWRI